MVQYVLRRLVMLVPVLLGVTSLTFAIIQITPGDPAVLMLGEYASPESVAQLRDQLGLNDPLLLQYTRYVWNAAHGDLGVSFRGQKPVLDDILERLPSTLGLAGLAMSMAILGGVVAGILAATAKRRLWDGLIMAVSLAGLSIPQFWLGILVVLFFGVRLRWISVTGGGGFKNLLLPALCLSLATGATIARLMRSTILEVLHEDYVRTARAKGHHERAVVFGHVLRNALIPVVTVMGLHFGYMLGGAFFIESVFARPGLGRFAIHAIQNRDYPQVQGMVLFVAVIYVLVNLVVDVVYGFIDPRIRYK